MAGNIPSGAQMDVDEEIMGWCDALLAPEPESDGVSMGELARHLQMPDGSNIPPLSVVKQQSVTNAAATPGHLKTQAYYIAPENREHPLQCWGAVLRNDSTTCSCTPLKGTEKKARPLRSNVGTINLSVRARAELTSILPRRAEPKV